MKITDTWEQIGEVIENGTHKTTYSIGDTKDLDIYIDGKRQTIQMQIAAFDTDNLFDTTGKAAITWISKDVICRHIMNPDAKNQGGWMLSDMRKYCEVLYNSIDEDARNLIKSVRKISYHYDTKSSHTTKDYCWIPSYREVFGSTDYEDHGPIYADLFSNDKSYIKKDLFNDSFWWWLRSCGSNSSYSFLRVNAGGLDYYSYAHGEYGVALGFST